MFIKHGFGHDAEAWKIEEIERKKDIFSIGSFVAWLESYWKCIISIVVRLMLDAKPISITFSHHVKPLSAFTIHHAEQTNTHTSTPSDDDDIDGFWYYDVDVDDNNDDNDGDDERHFRPILSKHLLFFFAQFSQCAFHKQIVSKTSVKCTKPIPKCKKYG